MPELMSAADTDAVATAVRVLRAGGTVVLPTDTVYGIAALPSRPEAIAAIVELKQRPPQMHLAVLVADVDQVARVSDDRRPQPRQLMAALWPGALTVVLGRATPEADALGPGDGTIGVRCPDDDLVRQICARVGPIAATSANVHGAPTPATAAEVATALGEVDLVLDGGHCPGGLASTVVDATGPAPVVLREGPIDEASIVAAWGARSGANVGEQSRSVVDRAARGGTTNNRTE